jgi:hypothetical protein
LFVDEKTSAQRVDEGELDVIRTRLATRRTTKILQRDAPNIWFGFRKICLRVVVGGDNQLSHKSQHSARIDLG